MMTQERIDYFLNLPKGEITDEEFEELKTEYFQAEKEDWYEEVNKDGEVEKKWDEEKVNVFWELVRSVLMPRFKERYFYDFNYFIFPRAEEFMLQLDSHGVTLQSENFWYIHEEPRFLYDLSFENATFLDQISFSETFDSNVSFRNTKFHGEVLFYNCTFKQNIDFTRSKSKNLKIYQCLLKDKIDLTRILVQEEFLLFRTQFIGEFLFRSLKPQFFKIRCTSCSFQLFKLYSELGSQLKPESFDYDIVFFDTEFNGKTKFSRINLKNIKFNNSYINDIYFNGCYWKDVIQSGRLIISQEISTKKDIPNPYQDAENQYRQLKQNFTNIGNWELAGYAYVSEMEMRKKRLKQEGKMLTWLFYWFYDFFGGYTQNFIRPIVAFFGSFVFFTLIYKIGNDWIDSIQMSIAGLIPYVEVQEFIKVEGYWLIAKNIQFILSVALLSFFVLALRNRFKL
jgi:uncharacterized protein YjbI with pentapeptide repeats